MKLTVEILKDLAKQGKTFNIVTEEKRSNIFDVEYNESNIIQFHVNSKLILYGRDNMHFSLMAKLQNMFEEAYQGFHLEIYELVQGMCTFVIRKNDVESLTISDDYKLVTEKMEEIKEVRKLIEETKDTQEKSLTYINDLYNKLVDVREYAKNLQLREENEKKVSEQLDSINFDIQELEIRLKKDIPELDKSLDINNFR
jgi:hypothetical protein